MNFVGDIYYEEPKTIWQKIGTFLGIILFLGCLWGIVTVASAYEEHKLCMNGAVEHCIPEDFQ